MVEPRRKCISIPAVNLKKSAIGGILSVTVVSANNIVRSNLKGATLERQLNSHGGNYSNGSSSGKMLNTFVEVELGDLMRRTKACQGSSPTWGDTFNMVLHENAGILKLHLYEQGSRNVKYDYLASCEIKVSFLFEVKPTILEICLFRKCVALKLLV